ncbi:MAG: nicotinate (nicotinamide) nucleotide adenylyltransferase [Geitlerinemataceae cyanobacterium]
MQKLGILGGTFDPPHWGHLVMAEAAYSQMKLDGVLWVPSQQPPHKLADNLSGFSRRVEWVRQTIEHRPEFFLSDVAACHRKNSYATDTLRDLQAIYPDSHWFWIVGLDTFQSLPRWYKCREVAAACQWLVAPRSPVPKADPMETGGKTSDAAVYSETGQACRDVARILNDRSISIGWHVLAMPAIDISSTLIRRYCREGRSIRYLVPESIRTEIETHLF